MDYFSIDDIATITGLTTRTLRNYISDGFLVGDKNSGKWLFTPEQVSAFLEHNAVKPTLQAKRNAIVYDHLANEAMDTERMCTILDIPGADSEKVSAAFCKLLADIEPEVEFKFASNAYGGGIRVILSGSATNVMDILKEFNETK